MTIQQAVFWTRDPAHDPWQLGRQHGQLAAGQKSLEMEETGAGSQGASSSIIRDHIGMFQAAQTIWFDKGYDACLVEAMTCRDGLKLAAQMGFQRVEIETECLQVVQPWNKLEAQRSIMDLVLREINDLRLGLSRVFFLLC